MFHAHACALEAASPLLQNIFAELMTRERLFKCDAVPVPPATGVDPALAHDAFSKAVEFVYTGTIEWGGDDTEEADGGEGEDIESPLSDSVSRAPVMRRLHLQLRASATATTPCDVVFGDGGANMSLILVFKAVQTTMGNRHTKQLVKAAAKGQAAIPTEMANAMQEVVKLGGGRNDPTQQLKKLRKIRNPYELQNRLMPYAGTFDDFNDRVIQFGYLVLFAPAYSLAPLLAFINNVIEIRTSGFKMCYAYQRPVWKARSGIGSWMVVLNVLGFLAVITNASMITFVGSQDAESLGLETSGFMIRAQQWQLWMRFVITEHSVLLMRTVILIVSPTLPRCKILLYTIYSTSQPTNQPSKQATLCCPYPSVTRPISHSPLQATHRRLYPCLLSFDVTDTLTD